MIFIVSSKIQTLIQFSVSLTCYARRGGYGKLVQRELEAQRQLVDYGTGSLTSFQPVMPPRCKFSVPFYVDRSTAITISNNYFTHHDKVMLLGHSDSYTQDKNMQATIAFNHFGEGLVQRMPR